MEPSYSASRTTGKSVRSDSNCFRFCACAFSSNLSRLADLLTMFDNDFLVIGGKTKALEFSLEKVFVDRKMMLSILQLSSPASFCDVMHN